MPVVQELEAARRENAALKAEIAGLRNVGKWTPSPELAALHAKPVAAAPVVAGEASEPGMDESASLLTRTVETPPLAANSPAWKPPAGDDWTEETEEQASAREAAEASGEVEEAPPILRPFNRKQRRAGLHS